MDDTITEIARDLIRQMQGEIDKLHDQLDDTNAMVSALNGDVHNIGQERDKLREQLVSAKAFIGEVADCENSDNVNIRRARELRSQLT